MATVTTLAKAVGGTGNPGRKPPRGRSLTSARRGATRKLQRTGSRGGRRHGTIKNTPYETQTNYR